MFKASIGVLVLGVSAAASQAAWAQDAKTGEELYLHHCATCHGIDAMGQGPMAAVLVVQPSDLTTLSNEEGVFRLPALSPALMVGTHWSVMVARCRFMALILTGRTHP